MEAIDALRMLEQWYTNRREQLRLIPENKDATYQIIGDGKKIELAPGTVEHKAFRAGIATALEIMGDWPVSIE